MSKLNFHSIRMCWTRKREAFTLSFAAELMVSGNGGCWDSALPCTGASPQIPCLSLRGLNPTKPSLFCCLCFLSALVLCLCPAQGAGRALPGSGDPSSQICSGPCSCCTLAVSGQIFSFLLRLCQYFFQKPPEGVISSQKCPPILGELSRQ